MPLTPSLNDLCNESKLESVMIKFLRSLAKAKLSSKNDAEIGQLTVTWVDETPRTCKCGAVSLS